MATIPKYGKEETDRIEIIDPYAYSNCTTALPIVLSAYDDFFNSVYQMIYFALFI